MIIAILILWLLDLLIPALSVPGFVYVILLISTLIIIGLGIALGADT